MSGTPVGALRTAARRIGMDPIDYAERIVQGLKRCTLCRAWHPRTAFGVESCRSDGLFTSCRVSRNRRARQRYAERTR